MRVVTAERREEEKQKGWKSGREERKRQGRRVEVKGMVK